MQDKNKGWSGRFSEPVDALVKRYTASVDFDQRLAEVDIQASLAHAAMLAAQGIISRDDYADIERGMAEILQEIQSGKFEWSLDLEDVHLNIEKRLTDKVGDAGKRLHTARSRNDQVATDIRLWLRAAVDDILGLIHSLQLSIIDLAEQHADTVMPGFTHLQVAQPVTFGHHLMAYFEMLKRDAGRFADCRKRINRLPLGAAALAGSGYPVDREMVARALGFDGVCENSLDAVSDRDFAIEFTAAAALVMTHLSRFSEELILWSSPRFGFVDIADRYCTGSSIMPQKKNPDVPELVRGKTGRVNGHLVALLTLMKGQPLAYNKDNQEDKEPLFDTVDTLADTLRIYADMLRGITVEQGRHAPCGAGRLRHGHRLGRLPSEKGPAVPRCTRGCGACGAPCGIQMLRSGGFAAGGTAPVFRAGGSRHLHRADAGRFAFQPQAYRRHRTGAGAAGDQESASGTGIAR